MKKLILLFIFAFSRASPAEVAVKVNSLMDVTINGQPRGGVVDVLANDATTHTPNLRARLLDELLALENRRIAEAASASKTQSDAAAKIHGEMIADAAKKAHEAQAAEYAERLAERDNRLAAAAAYIAALQKQIRELGKTPAPPVP